ncbi:MAG TPA: glycerol-3-phosphate 1-O-acyltransferase PlsY [Dehalococcoidia bacterium]|nr:glycerol-3-phosphate 1-O-acyltransferase PlsY [Dehalococcoidia bacterium]
MWEYIVAAVACYLVGSIPTGYLAGRLLRNIDVREYGSGATGATNVLRTLGTAAFLFVLIVDLLKGWIPVLLAWYLTESHNVQVVAGIFVVLGHNFPLYIGFRGGRGVATAMGVYAALTVPLAFALIPLAIFVLLAFRYMSLMSLVTIPTGAAALLILAIVGLEPYSKAVVGAIISILVVVRHRDNILRLIQGTEPKLGEGGKRRVAA